MRYSHANGERSNTCIPGNTLSSIASQNATQNGLVAIQVERYIAVGYTGKSIALQRERKIQS